MRRPLSIKPTRLNEAEQRRIKRQHGGEQQCRERGERRRHVTEVVQADVHPRHADAE